MNIYQRIILVVGGIALAYVIYMTLESTRVRREELMIYLTTEGAVTLKGIDSAFVILKYSCLTAIIRCAIVAALTFSVYVGFRTRKYYTWVRAGEVESVEKEAKAEEKEAKAEEKGITPKFKLKT